MIHCYSRDEIKKIGVACNVVAEALKAARDNIRAGMTTMELDAIIEDKIRSLGANPACKGYYGYPAASCISINDVVVHGIPGLEVIKDGDIVSVDITADKDGYFGDACRTFVVGNASEEAKKLVDVCEQAFFQGARRAKSGAKLGEVEYAIQCFAELHGTTVIREYTGHGIGRAMHEEPEVRNFGSPISGPRLKAGYCLAIEPMLTLGGWKTKRLSDGWTAKTVDGSLSAHYENTVVVTDGEPEILTLF